MAQLNRPNSAVLGALNGRPIDPKTGQPLVIGPSGPPPDSQRGKPSGPGPGGNSGSGPSAAENRAKAEADRQRREAGNRSARDAANLEAQARALIHALDATFAQARDQNLADVERSLNEQLDQLKAGHAVRYGDLLEGQADNEKEQGGRQETAFENLVKERSDTMTQILAQGAGETDALRATVLAARNYRDNQSEANRAYFDTLRSIRGGVNDLNEDVRTSMLNQHTRAESERERLWTDFYNRRSETWTQLGNVRQQQANLYSTSTEMGVNKDSEMKAANANAAQAFMEASNEAGKSYVTQGAPTELKDWKGGALPEGKIASTNLAAATKFEGPRKGEGASLRRWAA